MKKRKKKSLLKRILHRYGQLPQGLRSNRIRERNRAQRLLAITLILPVLLFSAGYIGVYEYKKIKTERENASYRDLYTPVTAEPTQMTTPTPTPTPTPEPTPTSTPTAEPTPQATGTASSSPVPTGTPTPSPTDTPEPTPLPTDEVAADITLSPYQTPNEDTLIYALETPPPVQSSFDALLDINEETIGYLSVGSDISLPVVQCKNDNDFYLTHNFELEESSSGTLFLDGANLLVPEDLNLIVYGHNMKNGTMFNALSKYQKLGYLKNNYAIYFDTIYKNRVYVPFAVFTASMDADDSSYLNIRQFLFDETTYELFVLKMQKLSTIDIPIDVRYGDNLLLLVTCEYTHDNGRLVVACRALRSDESLDMLQAQIDKSKLK